MRRKKSARSQWERWLGLPPKSKKPRLIKSVGAVSLKSVMTEEDEQRLLVQYLEIKKVVFYAIPNGELRTLSAGKRLKATGVRPGMPDLCIPVPTPLYHGLYIELKRKKGGTVSAEQKEWIAYLNSVGYQAVVCKGADEAIKVLEKYLWYDTLKLL